MRDAIEMIVKSLVDDAETVDVREMDRNGTTLIEVRVAQQDVGKIIGKQGRTIRALAIVGPHCRHKTESPLSVRDCRMKSAGEDSNEPLIVIARSVRTRGLKGEIVAELLTDFPERFENVNKLTAVSPDGEHESG